MALTEGIMSGQDEPGTEDDLPIGAQLRRAREAKGMSLDDVAGRTRIPIRHLQHIEREEWDALPAATYAVGFTRNYANAVGLDGAAMARELRDRIGGPSHRAAAPEYYAQADPARVPPRSLVFAAIFLAVLVGAYLVWRSTLDSGTGNVAPLEIPVAPATGPAPAPAQPAAPQPPAAAGQPVTLVATGEAWLRISEGQGGATIFQGMMAAGDRYQLPATAQHPMIHTGRPQNLHAMVGTSDLGALGPTEQTVTISLRPEDLAARAQAASAAAAPAPTAPPPAAPLAVPPAQQ
jgi:transcriptional regulator with XRE-family HTH domain